MIRDHFLPFRPLSASGVNAFVLSFGARCALGCNFRMYTELGDNDSAKKNIVLMIVVPSTPCVPHARLDPFQSALSLPEIDTETGKKRHYLGAVVIWSLNSGQNTTVLLLGAPQVSAVSPMYQFTDSW